MGRKFYYDTGVFFVILRSDDKGKEITATGHVTHKFTIASLVLSIVICPTQTWVI